MREKPKYGAETKKKEIFRRKKSDRSDGKTFRPTDGRISDGAKGPEGVCILALPL